jgi:hypothetical protein
VLQPGIEYFGAASDADAVAFGEGFGAPVSRLVRADGNAPDGLVAALASFLTARPLDELVSREGLEALSVESRGDMTITISRLPLPVGPALSRAADDELARVARRARIVLGFDPDGESHVAHFLGDLAEVARAGGGHLYSRVVAPSVPSEPGSSVASSIVAAAPIVGIVAAPVLIVLSGIAILAPGLSWLPFIPFLASVILLNLCIRTLRRRRMRRRLLAGTEGILGASFLAIVEPTFLAGLWAFQREVLDEEPTRPANGLLGRLIVDPSGIRVDLGGPWITISIDRIRGLALVPTSVDVASFDSAGEVAALAVLLRVDDDESISWIVTLVSDEGSAFRVEGSGAFAEYVSAILGVPDLTA